MRVLRTYPALASVNMPVSAVIVDALDAERSGHAPTIVAEVDPDDEMRTAPRSFRTARVGGEAIPPFGRHLATFRRHRADGGLTALYEVFATDVPDDLDPERHDDFRYLVDAGYRLGKPVGDCDRPETPKARPWIAPAGDEPTAPQVYAAVARLQEHGYGPIVGGR